ncbi:hypothetical protein [Empedobacter brevis]|uniref:hypothetical protein n=1 Tax=Empedobacter brevis TaxID=247 RepID=UPI002FE11DDF
MNLFQTNPDYYFSLIGKTKENELFQLFQTEFESEVSVQNIQQGKVILYKNKGIAVKIIENTLVSIKFFLSPNPVCKVYEGKNVFNLNRITDETQVRKDEHYQRIKNEDPNRLTNKYRRANCLFSFDSMTGEFLSIEILNELE